MLKIKTQDIVFNYYNKTSDHSHSSVEIKDISFEISIIIDNDDIDRLLTDYCEKNCQDSVIDLKILSDKCVQIIKDLPYTYGDIFSMDNDYINGTTIDGMLYNKSLTGNKLYVYTTDNYHTSATIITIGDVYNTSEKKGILIYSPIIDYTGLINIFI